MDGRDNRDLVLTKKIMRRIYLVWVARNLRHPLTLEGALFIFLLIWLLSQVSFASILNNILISSLTFSWFMNFMLTALKQAALTSQIALSLAFATLIFVFWTLRSLKKNLYFREGLKENPR